MTDIEALEAYRYVVAEVEAVGEQLAALDDLPKAVRDARIKLLQAQLEQSQETLKAVAQQAELVMNTQRDARTRLILRQYYALGRSDEKIGLVSGMSTRTVNKIRNRFLHDWAIIQESHLKK